MMKLHFKSCVRRQTGYTASLPIVGFQIWLEDNVCVCVSVSERSTLVSSVSSHFIFFIYYILTNRCDNIVYSTDKASQNT